MPKIDIVTNGAPPEAFLPDLKRATTVIGVDRAAFWLIQHGVTPSAAVGDFDSTQEEELALIQKKVQTVLTYPPEKNFTDTEIAVEYALKHHPEEIIIYGGVGTRLDHDLGTLFLLQRCHTRGVPAVLRTETNEVCIAGRGRTILYKREGYRYVSIIPVTDSIQISFQHVKYPVGKKIIRRGQTVGISNEFTGRQADLFVHRGLAFVIQSRDECISPATTSVKRNKKGIR